MAVRAESVDKREVELLATNPAVASALAFVRAEDDATLDDQLAAVRIPAPPFGEHERGVWMRDRFSGIGLADVVVDDVGNVLARLPAAASEGTPVLLSAHLDTVFANEMHIEVRTEGERIYAPGISDNARGLAALLTVARALVHANVRTRAPLVFVATVGEEGNGDLRGVKHIFREGSHWRSAAAFISLDGTGRRRIVHRAIGARRLRVIIHGQGGHSWADWGRPNPVEAIGVAIAELARVPLATQPRSALTVSRIGGGTSVNAIPESAWLEIDLRSESMSALDSLDARLREIAERAVRDTNARRRTGTSILRAEIECIGDRPTGELSVTSDIVRIARATTRYYGETAEMVSSSTDANIPISLGIPAIALGAGGDAGGTHTLDEWYRNDDGAIGIQRALLTTLMLTGVE